MRLAVLAAALTAACTASTSYQPPAPAPTVRFFGNPPPKDQTGRVGVEDPPQSYTPEAKTTPRTSMIRELWKVSVGATDARTTMAFVRGHVLVGTRGAQGGVHVVDAAKGNVARVIRARAGEPGVSGLAADGEHVVFASEGGQVTRATLAGAEEWSARAKGAVAAAPALADLNGDGRLDAVVGDAAGALSAFDGKTGHLLWQRAMSAAITEAAALADANADGTPDVLAVDGAGLLGAYSGKDGAPLWTHRENASSRSAPSVADVNADGHREVLAAWDSGRVAILDLASGAVRWKADLERDDGTPSAVLSGVLAMPGPRVASLVVPTDDGVVVHAQRSRAWRAKDGAVRATPVVARLEADGPPAAIFGTKSGDVVALDTLGRRFELARVSAAVEAPALLADGNADGLLELYVASADGALTCLHTTAPAPAWLSRHRGDPPTNAGVVPDVDLGWALTALDAPSAGGAQIRSPVR